MWVSYGKLINAASEKLRQEGCHQFEKSATFNNQIKPEKCIGKITLEWKSRNQGQLLSPNVSLKGRLKAETLTTHTSKLWLPFLMTSCPLLLT